METIEIKVSRSPGTSEVRFAFEVLNALRCLKMDWFEPNGDLPVIRDSLLQKIADEAAGVADDTEST